MIELVTGKFFIRLKNKNAPIQEFEIGLDDNITFEYYHHWQGDQLHCLSVGNLYFCWKGFPYIDKK